MKIVKPYRRESKLNRSSYGEPGKGSDWRLPLISSGFASLLNTSEDLHELPRRSS
ncbi:hypothetical protein Syun_029308 [Stephania yunnanensis]|uniref:Uncharacterized protein n=1 Tax=Stephania yunnanensis TaxID=152371 RepID=A0AAP0E5C2_9MAGN